MFDGIEADCAKLDGLSNSDGDQFLFEHLHQAQDLDELALALVTRPPLHQPAQMIKLLGQIPVLQWRRLIQGSRLLFQERKIV